MLRPPPRTRPALAALLTLATLAGCADSPPAPADPGRAREALPTALDAWKRGDRPDALTSSRPPVRVLDRDWSEGSTLAGYEVKGDGHPLGHNIQQTVALDLKTPRGKAVKKTVNYVISPGDPPTVARQDIDE